MKTTNESTGKTFKDPRRMALIKRLEAISNECNAWWFSPKGKLCRITNAGLFIEDQNPGVLPWRVLTTTDLELIVSDNERNIKKSPQATKEYCLAEIKKMQLMGEDVEGAKFAFRKVWDEEPNIKELDEKVPEYSHEEEIPF